MDLFCYTLFELLLLISDANPGLELNNSTVDKSGGRDEKEKGEKEEHKERSKCCEGRETSGGAEHEQERRKQHKGKQSRSTRFSHLRRASKKSRVSLLGPNHF